MIGTIIVMLIALWILGYIHITVFHIPDIILFHINSRAISLWDILLLFVIVWAIEVLPYPFQQIAGVLLLLWLLSTLGIVAIAGLPSILVVAIIVGLIFFLLEEGI